jgi:hypothetical protein
MEKVAKMKILKKIILDNILKIRLKYKSKK